MASAKKTTLKSTTQQQRLIWAAEEAQRVGQRWTAMRQSVYEGVLGQAKPVTAYQLIDQLSKKQGKNIKPASVYRSLDALCAMGLVVKIESLNAFAACAHPDHHHEHVFLVCRHCGTADELADKTISQRLSADAAHRGFAIKRHILELQGACRLCQD